MNQKISPKIIALTFGVLVISFLMAFYVVAWQEPVETPPEGNVSAPLNAGNVGQSKEGGLILNTGGALIGLIVDTGQTILDHLATPFTLDSSSRPDTPTTGDFYFDQTDQNLYYYNGVMWMRIEAVPSGTGEACSVSGDCESGNCVDGYCCDSACNTTCSSCNVPGLEGHCTALTNMAEDGGCSGSCKGCYDGSCVNFSTGSEDSIGANTCTATHYRCDGVGNCSAPKTYGNWTHCLSFEVGTSLDTLCQSYGYEGLYQRMLNACYSCGDPNYIRTSNTTCSTCDLLYM